MSTLNGGPGNIVTNGLVLYLDAANYLSYTSGSTVWRDLSSSNNSGSLINGPTFSSGNAGSIVFDGVDDYVDSINQFFNIQDNTPFSVNVVFKTSLTGAAQLIGNWNTLVTPGWRIDIVSGNIRFLILDTTGINGRAIRTNLTYNDNRIYNFCATYSGNGNVSGISLYVNSLPLETTTILNTTPTSLTNSKITLGASQLNTTNITNYLTGNLYNVSLYNRVLTASIS